MRKRVEGTPTATDRAVRVVQTEVISTSHDTGEGRSGNVLTCCSTIPPMSLDLASTSAKAPLIISSSYALTAGVISLDEAFAATAGAGAAMWPATASCEADVGDLREDVGAGDDWDEATSSSLDVTAALEYQHRVIGPRAMNELRRTLQPLTA